jgi:pimeloyl-ACP methyl ester carboxylesterase
MVDTGRAKISTLVAGDPLAEPLVLIHGLGATKASWLTVVPELARHFRVMAIDLPGFGASSKPFGRYDAPWFSRHVVDFLDALGIDDTVVAGNSMGGRIAQELAMSSRDRVRAIACLCPATAFSNRPFLFFARLARAELGIAVTRLPRERLRSMLMQLFADPKRIDPEWFDAAIDDFRYVWRNPRARVAFFAAARRIYLEEGMGEEGFWARLSKMSVPALYIYGERDTLITHHFARKIRNHLPGAEVQVWKDCGHTPQLEWPDRTAKTLLDFFEPHLADSLAS